MVADWAPGDHVPGTTNTRTREMTQRTRGCPAEQARTWPTWGPTPMYWQCRYEDDEYTLVEYRTHGRDPESDPARRLCASATFGQPRPQCRLLGIQYQARERRAGSRPALLRRAQRRRRSVARPAPGSSRQRTPRACGLRMGRPSGRVRATDLIVFFEYGARARERALHPPPPRLRRDGVLGGSLQFAWGLDDWGHEGARDLRLQRVHAQRARVAPCLERACAERARIDPDEPCAFVRPLRRLCQCPRTRAASIVAVGL